jgi:hypothetical protein
VKKNGNDYKRKIWYKISANGENIWHGCPPNAYDDSQTFMCKQEDVTWSDKEKDGRNNSNSLGTRFSTESLLWTKTEEKVHLTTLSTIQI